MRNMPLGYVNSELSYCRELLDLFYAEQDVDKKEAIRAKILIKRSEFLQGFYGTPKITFTL